MNTHPLKIYCAHNGIFPNSQLPVLLYKKVIAVPRLLAAKKIKNLFSENDWGNAWDSGIFTYNHYHSTTHEVPAYPFRKKDPLSGIGYGVYPIWSAEAQDQFSINK
jgi:uncharacterized protein YjlB